MQGLGSPYPVLVFFFTEKQLCAHMMGQRHWRNMRMKGESERSVYVRGFPSDSTTVEDLSKLFEQFGSVHRVIMEDKVGPSNTSVYIFTGFKYFEFCILKLYTNIR